MDEIRILLVGDQPENSDVLQDALSQLNATMVQARTVEAAFKAADGSELALLLVNTQASVSDAVATAIRLKQNESLRSAPLLFLTSPEIRLPDILSQFPPGTVDVLLKPFVPDVLRARISLFLELFRSKQALQQNMLQGQTNQRLRFLSSAGELLAGSLDYDVTLNNLRHLILPDLADIFTVDVIQPTEGLTRIALAATEPETEALVIEQNRRFPPDLSSILLSPAFMAGETFFFEHITPATYEAVVTDPDHLALLRKLDATSEILVPLRVRDTPIGILTVVRQGTHPAYTQNDVTLIEELARRVAQAIDNARLYREAQEQRERLKVTLTSIGDAVIATDEHGTVTFMNPIAERLTGWQQADAAHKPLVDVFNIVNERTRQRVESPVEKVLREGVIVGLANHTILIARDGRKIPIDDSGAPIRTPDGAVAGVILVFRDITERQAMERERAQLLLQEQQAHTTIQAANEKLQFLTRVSSTLVSSIDYEQTLGNLAELLVPQMADNCIIDLVTSDSSLERVAVAATDPAREEVLHELARRYPPDPKGTSTRQLVAQRTPRLVPQLTDDYYAAAAQSPEHFELMKASGGKSLLIVPLVLGERSLGAISMGMVESGRVYNEADLNLMTEVAQRAAFAVEHARLYREAQAEISRRQHAEAELQKSSLQMQLIADGLPLLISYVDTQERYQFVNKAYTDWFGINQDSLVGKQIRDLGTAAAYAELQPRIQQALAGQTVRFESGFMYRQVGWREVDVTYIPHIDDQGTVRGFIVLVLDVTERKQADADRQKLLGLEQEARTRAEASERRLAFLSDASAVLATSLDYEATVAVIPSLAVPQLSDYCAVDILEDGQLRRTGYTSIDFGSEKRSLLEEFYQQFTVDLSARAGVAEAIRTGKPRFVPEITDADLVRSARSEHELQLMRAIGFSGTMILPLVGHGIAFGALTFTRIDRSSGYTSDDLLLAEELARRISLALDNARLYQNAQEAIRSRDEFLSVAAHELKTPVTSIRGFAQTLLRQVDKTGALDITAVRRAAQTIDKQSVKLTTLISQLLDLSRLEMGRLVLEKQASDVVLLTQEAVDNIQRATTKHIITLKSPKTLNFEVDPIRLEQVIVNLLENAVKYSPDGGQIQVEISVSEPTIMSLSIEDRGLGIPVEHREHLFDRFYQAHQKGYLGGMGLGLYISRQIIELHGGSIYAEFPSNGGTRFVIQLPGI